MKYTAISLLLLVFLLGCNEPYPYETGAFSEFEVINLTELNSPYDDMNSDYNPPFIAVTTGMIFSSNGPSLGGDFNLVNRDLQFIWSKEEATLNYEVYANSEQFRVQRNKLLEVNTGCNEKGPYSFSHRVDNEGRDFLMYSSDCEGSFQIQLARFTRDSGFGEGFSAEKSAISLFEENSNEMYPCFFAPNHKKGEGFGLGILPELFLFSSDRDGQFDIYELDLSSHADFTAHLTASNSKEIRKSAVNSEANDHMPFVYGDLLVFTSDRPGGFGGYDLYYSLRSGNGWSEPVNFGPTINSESDEYRPVVLDHWEFTNQVMIFSSNRPGGLGGFDLYFVGIPKL
ncbi:TolB-like translocation protein [Algoriphagus namhaensis]